MRGLVQPWSPVTLNLGLTLGSKAKEPVQRVLGSCVLRASCRSTFIPQGQGRAGRVTLLASSSGHTPSAPGRCGGPGAENRAEPSLRSQPSGWHGVCGDGQGGPPGGHPSCRQRRSPPSSALLTARCWTAAPRASTPTVSRMVAAGRVTETWPARLSDCTFDRCRDTAVLGLHAVDGCGPCGHGAAPSF